MQIPVDYGEAIRRKYPEQIVISISKDPQGKYNPITLGWSMIASGSPRMLAIGVGLNRYSLEALQLSRSFTLVFPSGQMADDAMFHGSHSGRDMDKLKEVGTKIRSATEIDSVIMEDAVSNFECVVEIEVPSGDHVLFVGRVVAAHTNEDESLKRVYNLGGHGFKELIPAL